MKPGQFDFDLYRGDTYAWRFLLWQDAAQTIAVDLTGATAKAEIRNIPGGGALVALVCVVTAPNIIDATLNGASSQQLPETGVWDLQLTYPTGKIRTVLAGAVTAVPDVTDSAPASRWATTT